MSAHSNNISFDSLPSASGMSSPRPLDITDGVNGDLFPTDAMASSSTTNKVVIDEMGFPSSSAVTSPKASSSAAVSSPTWKISSPVDNKFTSAYLRSQFSSPVSEEASTPTRKSAGSILAKSPRVTTTKTSDGDEEVAVEVALVTGDVDASSPTWKAREFSVDCRSQKTSNSIIIVAQPPQVETEKASNGDEELETVEVPAITVNVDTEVDDDSENFFQPDNDHTDNDDNGNISFNSLGCVMAQSPQVATEKASNGDEELATVEVPAITVNVDSEVVLPSKDSSGSHSDSGDDAKDPPSKDMDVASSVRTDGAELKEVSEQQRTKKIKTVSFAAKDTIQLIASVANDGGEQKGREGDKEMKVHPKDEVMMWLLQNLPQLAEEEAMNYHVSLLYMGFTSLNKLNNIVPMDLYFMDEEHQCLLMDNLSGRENEQQSKMEQVNYEDDPDLQVLDEKVEERLPEEDENGNIEEGAVTPHKLLAAADLLLEDARAALEQYPAADEEVDEEDKQDEVKDQDESLLNMTVFSEAHFDEAPSFTSKSVDEHYHQILNVSVQEDEEATLSNPTKEQSKDCQVLPKLTELPSEESLSPTGVDDFGSKADMTATKFKYPDANTDAADSQKAMESTDNSATFEIIDITRLSEDTSLLDRSVDIQCIQEDLATTKTEERLESINDTFDMESMQGLFNAIKEGKMQIRRISTSESSTDLSFSKLATRSDTGADNSFSINRDARKIRLFVTPTKEEVDPASKSFDAFSNIESVDMDVSFSYDNGPMLSCGTKDGMFAVDWNQDAFRSIFQDFVPALADTVSEGFDMLASEFPEHLGSDVANA